MIFNTLITYKLNNSTVHFKNMSKKNISTTEVSDPSANAITRVIGGTLEVSKKPASEPVSDNMHSGELWEFSVWKRLLKV